MRRWWIATGFLLLSCGRPAETPATLSFPRAPVILISVDTLRSDHLPAYGYKGVETPAIDALAQDGVVFESAWSHCPMTLPSHVSMLTGQLPTEHGVRNNAGFTWDARGSLPQVLAAQGYATGASVSSYVLRGDTGMRKAFAFYDEVPEPAAGSTFVEHQRTGDVTTANAERWLDRAAVMPFFLFLHLYEPHVPYAPPEPYRSRYASAYDGEIASADAIVGSMLAYLKRRGLYDDAIIILTSDHGEGFGDHGEEQHSITLYREAIQIPLIVKLPKNTRGGERIAAPVGLFDIAPTIAALTGVSMQASPKSANLFEAPASRNLYAETIYPYLQLGWSDLRALVNERWHLIEGPSPELYDYRADSAERTNRLNDERRLASSLLAEVRTYPPATSVQSSVDPETARRLASLGYIGTVRERPDPRTLPNPNEAVSILGDLQKAFALAQRGEHATAIPALQAILERFPRMQEVRVRLAESQADLGKLDEAVASYRTALASSEVQMPEIMISLLAVDARASLAKQNLDRAVTLTQEAERLAQKPVLGMSMVRGEVFARRERPEDAIRAYRAEIAAFPSHAEAYARLAVVLFLTGDRTGFEETLRALTALDPAMAARTRAVMR